jgi:hypothetical protein
VKNDRFKSHTWVFKSEEALWKHTYRTFARQFESARCASVQKYDDLHVQRRPHFHCRLYKGIGDSLGLLSGAAYIGAFRLPRAGAKALFYRGSAGLLRLQTQREFYSGAGHTHLIYSKSSASFKALGLEQSAHIVDTMLRHYPT